MRIGIQTNREKYLKKIMMKKRLTTLIAAVLFAIGGLFLASCDSAPTISGISMVNEERVQVPFGNFSYDGVKVNVNYENGDKTEINLTEDMISLSERLKFYKMGEQDVEVNFRERYFTTMKVDVVFNTFKDIYKLEDLEVSYDGLPHSLSLNEELPEGAKIEYPYGNTFTAAGVYEVVGVITKSGYESKTLKATLTINPAEHETKNIVFNDARFVYSGEMKTVEATNVPEGVSVEYDIYDEANVKIHRIVNVGKYKVVAKFNDSNNNYKKIDDMTASVTVVKGDYDMSPYTLEDVARTYDGKKYEAHIANEDALPAGVSVSYKYLDSNNNKVTDNSNAGAYTMVAEFSGGDSFNYNPIEPLKATLIVDPCVYDLRNKVFFEGATWNFEESPKPLSIIYGDDFPSEIIDESLRGYNYYQEDGVTPYHDGDFTYAGEYLIICDFYSTSANYSFILDDLRSYIYILPINKAVNITSLSINGSVVNVTTDTTGVILQDIVFYNYGTSEKVEIADLVGGVTYQYHASLRYEDDNLNNSVNIPEISGEYMHPIS